MAELSNTPMSDAFARGSSNRPGSFSSRAGRRRADGRPSAAPVQQGIGLRFIANALRQWWKLAVPVGLLLAAAAGITVYLIFEPVFQASAWLRIESRALPVIYGDQLGSGRFVQNQIHLMRSPLVLGQVITDEDVAKAPEIAEAPDAIRYLQSGLSVASVGGSEYYQVSFQAHDPELSARVVTAVVNSYFQLQGKEQAERAQRVIELLEQERDRRALEVGRLREQVRTLTLQATGKDPFAPTSEDQPRAADSPLVRLKSRLTSTEVELEVLKARIEAYKDLVYDPEAKVDDNNIVQMVDRDPGIREQKKLLEDRRVELQKLAQQLPGGTENPQYLAASEQLAKQQEEFDKALNRLKKALAIEVPPEMIEQALSQNMEIQQKAAELEARQAGLATLETRLAKPNENPIYLKEAEALRSAVEEFEKLRIEARSNTRVGLQLAMLKEREQELDAMEQQRKAQEVMCEQFREKLGIEIEQVTEATGETLDLQFKKAELQRSEEVLGLIADRIMKLRTEQRAPGRVTLMQAAEAPKAPLEVVPWKKIVLFSLAAFCAPLGLAVGWERLVRRVSDAEQIEQDVNLSVVGEVARLPVRASTLRQGWGRSGAGVHVYEESIDSLRTSLTLSEPLKDMQVLAVTSATNGEGKTSVAVQLAVSIARASSKPTLLIDGDMRAPDIHRLLGVGLEPGLSEVLAGSVSLDEAIRTEWSDYVHLLPAGKALASPHKLLGNGSLKSLLDKVRDSYRYVVIDTPPVLAAAEALVLAKNADASLICAMRDSSRVDQIRRTYDRLLGAEANPVGVVLNGIPPRRYAYRYGAYGYTHAVDDASSVEGGNGHEASSVEDGNGYEASSADEGDGYETTSVKDSDGYETYSADDGNGYETTSVEDGVGYETYSADDGNGYETTPVEDSDGYETPSAEQGDDEDEPPTFPTDDEIR